MCGIAGILNLTSSDSINDINLKKMVKMLEHRGPDGNGTYIDNWIGLAHTRLSIIDITSGKQPIHNEDETIQVVFNGEIFNYIELRANLETKGHQFYTHTDTEVIVHLYEEYGENFVSYLNGQFAIALWDITKKRLLLVRDRVGILPLFYTEHSGQLIFGSEIKTILSVIRQSPKLNTRALDQIMTFWAPLSPETIFDGIYEVSPGEIIIIHDGKLKKKKYWNWLFPAYGEYYSGSAESAAEMLHDLLVDATKLRLRSDVPVGAYLSGGLDSSVLVSLIHHYSNVPLRTFSIGFEDKGLDETEYQRTLINHLKTKHTRIDCKNSDVADNFIETIWHTETPILRSAPVPMGLLSKLVHDNGYKVVLTGEGSDEVLGGYDIFKEAKIRQFWARNPNSKFRSLLLKRLYPYLNITGSQGQAYVKNFFGIGLDTPDTPYFAYLPRWATTAKCKEFFSIGIKEKLQSDAISIMEKSLPGSITQWHPFNQAQYIEAKVLMAGYLLCSQGDRMLMSNSVEGRFPFLDHRVIEFANMLNPKLKMKVLNEKYLLKMSMKQYIPESIVKRFKQPYRAPDIPAFFSGHTPEYVNELTSKEKLEKYGYFDSEKVRRLLDKIRRGRAIGYKDNMAFIGILSTQIWHHHFINNYYQNFR